jgi:protein ImuB
MKGAVDSKLVPPLGSERRVVAVILPELLTELAITRLSSPGSSARSERARRPEAQPLGVLLVESAAASLGALLETATLAAVNHAAESFGVRVGQTVAEAHAFVSRLVVKEITREQLLSRLGEIAEVALGFGPTVSLEAPDTVWVDVTGASHLAGGEEALALDLGARVRALGHRVRVGVASGPRLAQAFARWGRVSREGCLIVSQEETARRVAELPVRALPIDTERAAWLVRLGVLTVGAVSLLPRAAAASRLGEEASRVLDLAEGRDDSPLVAYVPPAIPHEETTWDEPIDGTEPLLFVLRGLVSRLSARLEGRGEAVQALNVVISHDRSVSRLAGVPAETTLHFDLAAPIHRAEELFRVIASRLGRTEFVAPTVGLGLEARAITRALALQLDLSRYASGLGGSSTKGPETLPVLLGELLADLGKERVGIFSLEGSHRPEKKSRLIPVTPSTLASGKRGRGQRAHGEAASAEGAPNESSLMGAPTRLLPRPVPFDAPLRRGATLSLEHRLYSIERVVFERRLEGIEWWSGFPVSRDYVRIWLRGQSGGVEAIVYVDRASRARMIQAICD